MENRVERERESLFAGLWLPGLGPPRDLFGHHGIGPHGGGQGPMDRDLLARAKMNTNDSNNPFKSLNFGLNLGNSFPMHSFFPFHSRFSIVLLSILC